MSSLPSARRSRSRTEGFTLVELLVVIGIIALLVSILLPALNKARERANEIACQSNQRQLMMGFLMFANDHQGCLPGNWWDANLADAEHRSWLRNAGEPWDNAPQNGTLFRYMNNNYGVYRCRSLEQYYVNAQNGTNGRYDYASFLIFSGAKVTNIRAYARFTYPGTGQVVEVDTPVIMEEEPQNGINGGNVEGGHCESDRFGHAHKGGSYYASIDGSIHWFKEPLNANSHNWTSQCKSGTWTSLGIQPVPTWGWWNTH
jgi:prepilin-type N-terminal cleavage/methylation domain-containing protein